MVFEGVPAGGDKRLAVMWLNQGEPTVGCYIPFFPAAEAVSPLAYQDTTIGGIGYDLNDSCFINQAYSTAETRYGLYSTNLGDLVSGMYDMSIDPTALAAVQAWSLPIEAAVLENTEIFMGLLGADSGRITAANMKAFSDYCAVYTYWNYLKASPAAVPWNCPIPE